MLCSRVDFIPEGIFYARMGPYKRQNEEKAVRPKLRSEYFLPKPRNFCKELL